MYIATLVKGLKDTSRIKMLAAGLETSVDRLLLAHLIDNTAINVWMKTEDAQKGKNRPKSFVTMLTEKIDESKLTKPFETSADFEAEWRRLNGI